MFTKLIERNSTIPTKKTKVFTTVTDNQSKVEINVLQGEREVANYNKSLGRFELVGIPPAPKGVPQIDVTFDIDSNGIVHVSAKDKATSKEQKIVVTPSSGLTDKEIGEIISDAHKHSEDDRRRSELNRIQARLEGLLDSNERTFAEFGKALEEGKRKTVQRILENARKALQGSNLSESTKSLEKLAEAAQILTEVILYDPSKISNKEPGGELTPVGAGKTDEVETS
jgi:molecular chaperone DnaK